MNKCFIVVDIFIYKPVKGNRPLITKPLNNNNNNQAQFVYIKTPATCFDFPYKPSSGCVVV